MKRFFFLLLILALVISLGACSYPRSGIKDPVAFYYQRADFLYGTEDGVIASEEREASGHTKDLAYLLSLYLAGPLDEELTSPFLPGTRLLSVQEEEDTIQIELSMTEDPMSASQFSLACACLTMTCLELTEATEVTITSGGRSLTMTRESLLLFDDSAVTETTTNGG